MKKFIFIFILFFAFLDMMGQRNTVYSVDLTPYVGTWVYENQDTVFTVKLQMAKDTLSTPWEILEIFDCLVGGYSLKINGVETDNYIKELPTSLNFFSKRYPDPRSNVYLFGHYNVREKVDLQDFKGVISFTFFDRRKKHNEGGGLFAARIKLLAPDKLHWWLEDEKKVLVFQDIWEPLVGYSVPTNAVMRKIK